jgi:hypothetical protein
MDSTRLAQQSSTMFLGNHSLGHEHWLFGHHDVDCTAPTILAIIPIVYHTMRYILLECMDPTKFWNVGQLCVVGHY